MGSRFLYHPFTYYVRQSGGGILPFQLAPNTPQEYYNYLTGKWRNGAPFSQGGNAFNPGAPFYPFAFDGSDIDGTPWTECNVGTNPSDRRMLMSFGPVDLMPGERRRLAFAVVTMLNQEYPCPDLSLIVEESDAAEAFYFEQCGEMVPVNVSSPLINEDNVLVAPNPFTSQTSLSLKRTSSMIKEVRLYTMQGQLIRSYEDINQNSFRIDRADLTNGFYLYQLISEDNKVLSGRLVIH